MALSFRTPRANMQAWHPGGAMKMLWLVWSALAAAVVLLTSAPELGTRQASAADFCVQLTRQEFDLSRRRRGEGNACSDQVAAERARSRARDAAYNAIDHLCLNNVTQRIAAAACTRAAMAVNASFFLVIPPWESRPTADVNRYAGRGVAGVHVCVLTNDLATNIVRSVDGSCAQNTGFQPLSSFATARARAHCAVVCSTP